MHVEKTSAKPETVISEEKIFAGRVVDFSVRQARLSDGTIVGDLPQENTTETKNEVMVRDGQTFVIAGLMKDKETENNYGVPFLMDIPLLLALN